MEILELPQDILWDGDQSPMTLSPDHYSDASAEQILIFEDSFATEPIPNDDLIKPNQTFEFSPEDFEQLLEIQQDLLDNMDAEDQSNDQWLDQPIIPLDEYAPALDARIHPVKVNATAQLLNEFDRVYDAVELTHLTPPETPPHTPPQTPLQAYLHNDSKQNQFYPQPVTNYQLQLDQQFQQCKPESKPIATTNYMPAIPAQQFPTILEQAINLVQQTNPIEYTENFEDAMAEVEALVRSRAEDFAESSIDDDSSMCGSSSCYSPRSEASSNITDDSDWTMKSSPAIATALKNKQAKQKRKPRINRRSPEDRQSRKKEQNKSAANRYRLKKKAEIEILLDEERDLIKRNEALQSQFEDVDREVKFIKKLLRDLFKAKGLIK